MLALTGKLCWTQRSVGPKVCQDEMGVREKRRVWQVEIGQLREYKLRCLVFFFFLILVLFEKLSELLLPENLLPCRALL